MLKEIVENINEVSDDDVQYWYLLAAQAKGKKDKIEVTKILKDAGCPQDIIADLTQRWGKGR